MRPRSAAQWMRWAEGQLSSLAQRIRSVRGVPVGAMVRIGVNAELPEGWLEQGVQFDAQDYPLLAEALGTTQTPDPGGADASLRWIIRGD